MLAGSMKHGVYIKRTEINAPLERVFDWHAQDGAIARLTPPWAPLKLISRSGSGIEKGVTVVFKISLFKLPMRWEAVHIDYQHHDYFKDRQIKGPFGRWEHTHRFIPSGKMPQSWKTGLISGFRSAFCPGLFTGLHKKSWIECFGTATAC